MVVDFYIDKVVFGVILKVKILILYLKKEKIII